VHMMHGRSSLNLLSLSHPHPHPHPHPQPHPQPHPHQHQHPHPHIRIHIHTDKNTNKNTEHRTHAPTLAVICIITPGKNVHGHESFKEMRPRHAPDPILVYHGLDRHFHNPILVHDLVLHRASVSASVRYKNHTQTSMHPMSKFLPLTAQQWRRASSIHVCKFAPL